MDSKAVQEALYNAFKSFFDSFRYTVETLAEMAAEIEEAIEPTESRACRRKQARGRTQAIEQRYRAEIRRLEHERVYRRIYKPP